MKVLGIETSCDETAAAVVEDGTALLSNVVSSQMDDFARYGGVVPEVAARSHLEVMLPVVEKALTDAQCSWDDIDAIAVTYAPGLVGSLLIGTLCARTLAIMKNKPLYPIHHVEGHVYANFITRSEKEYGVESMKYGASQTAPANCSATSGEDTNSEVQPELAVPGQGQTTRREMISLTRGSRKGPVFPLLALIVSGGHSQLALFRDHGNYVLLGQTQDDAVGEAFDKVAKMIGLPYPGGVSISKLAPQGDAHAFAFPKAKLACPAGCTHELNRAVTQDDIDSGRAVRGGRGEYFLRERCHQYDFSFSGLKTAVLRAVQRGVGVTHDFPSHQLPERVSDSLRANIAASFQETAVDILVDKTVAAYENLQPATVVIAGGVAANQELRRTLRQRLPVDIEYAPMELCTDNAAMIASLGYYYAQKNDPADPRVLEIIPSLSMTKTAWAK